MARTKSAAHGLRRSPRFMKQNDEFFKNPNLKSASVSRPSPRVGKLIDTDSVPDPKIPHLESVRSQVRLSSRDRMARTKSAAHVLRRSPRFRKQNDGFFENPNFKSESVSSSPSPRIGKLRDTDSVPDPKTPHLESVRSQVRLSSRDRSLVSSPSCADVVVNEEVRKSFVSELRRSPRFRKSCVEQIFGQSSGASELKSGAKVKSRQENTRKEGICLRRSSRFSNQPKNYKDADRKLDSILGEICGNDGENTDPSMKKHVRKGGSPIGSGDELPQMGEEASWKNEGKGAEVGRRKRKRANEGSEVLRGWTKEQEMALERAYMAMKPTPHFWKKVSKMVGKSAQECFDRINYDAHTPVPPRIKSRLKKKMSPSMSGCSHSASKLLGSPSQKLARKRKTQIGHKKLRELLRRQCNTENDYEGDLFSVLEGNMASSHLKVPQQPPAASTLPAVSLGNGSNSFSARKKCASRLSKAALLVSPPVLKQVKNKALHEKYIDQLHVREAKRKAELTRAKKTTYGKENLAPPSCNQKSNVVEAAKEALEADARDVILQFQQVQAKLLNNSPSECEDDIPLSSDEIEDEL